MNLTNCISLVLGTACALLARTAVADAPASKSDSRLRAEVLRADAELFDAFNHADLKGVARMLSPDLEFYQDNEGVASYKRTLEDFKSMFAQANHIRRVLDAASVDIRPIKGFGALEIGSHRFCHVENSDEICGDFRFVHLWRNAAGTWQLARVISYGHKLEE